MIAVSITLYSADICPYCVRTRLVMNGKGIDHTLVDVDLPDKPAWLRELNPRNRVPVLDHDGAILWESEALNDYLEALYPQPAMLPADPAGRARVRMVLRRFEDLTDAFYAARRGEDGAVEDLHAQLAWLSELVEDGGYLVGDSYTLAEPGVWPWIVRLYRVGVDIADYPALAAWCERLAAREEYAAELNLLAAA
jgi:glutathione S-transferase